MKKISKPVIAAARRMGWKEFIAWHIARVTARRPHEGYSVAIVEGGLVELRFGGIALYAPMTPETAYSWFERCPLVTLSRDADEIRRVAHEAPEGSIYFRDAYGAPTWEAA